MMTVGSKFPSFRVPATVSLEAGKHFEEINAVGALHAPWLPPPARIVQVLR